MCFPVDQDKDSLTDDKYADISHKLIDFLSDQGFDLIGHTNSQPERVANSALDEGELSVSLVLLWIFFMQLSFGVSSLPVLLMKPLNLSLSLSLTHT